MAEELFSVEGAKIFIGGTVAAQKADFAEGDFSTETWQEIDGWETCGSLADDQQIITTPLINRPRDFNRKGTRNAAGTEMNFAVVPGDAGQAALVAADKERDNYAFKIEWDDMPDGGISPTTLYFIALVHSTGEQGGNANTMRMLRTTLQRNSNLVKVAAA